MSDPWHAKIPPRAAWLAGVVAVSLFAIVCNPWVVMPDRMYDPIGEGVLIAQGLAAIAWCVGVCALRLRSCACNQRTAGVAAASESGPVCAGAAPVVGDQFWRAAVPLTVVLGLWSILFRNRWLHPVLFKDDFEYIAIAGTWSSTWKHLFAPYNEHFCVPTRLLTWAVCAVATQNQLPRALAVAGMGLFTMVWVPLFLFVRRAWNSPVLGTLAVSLFALNSVHSEVVTWYSASQWCWAMLMLLAALLLMQRGSAAGVWPLVASAALAVAGTLSYAVGALVGPVTSAYLALSRRADAVQVSWIRCGIPALATGTCLIVLACWKGPEIARRADYDGRTPAEAIAPLRGVLYGVRSTIDMLVLGNLGAKGRGPLPRTWYAVAFPVVIFAVGELILRAARPAPLILGLLLVIVPYALMLPFRAWVQYDTFLIWSRYQLFPQLGVLMLVCGAVAEFGPRWLRATTLSWRHAAFLGAFAMLQFAVHAVR